MNKNQEGRNAILFWVCMMAAYAAMGFVQMIFGLSLGLLVNLIFMGSCIVFTLRETEFLRKTGTHKVDSGLRHLGFRKEYAGRSCAAGLACGAAIVAINGIFPGILSGSSLASPSSILLWLCYYMAVIAIPEEIIFRGYLLAKLERAMDSEKKAILASGVFFMLIHVPYQLIVSEANVFAWLLDGNLFTLAMTFLWHLVFCLIYKKTGALYGAILFHGLMDWSNELFL